MRKIRTTAGAEVYLLQKNTARANVIGTQTHYKGAFPNAMAATGCAWL